MCEPVWKFSFFRASQERRLFGTNYLARVISTNWMAETRALSATVGTDGPLPFLCYLKRTSRVLPEEICRAILARRLLHDVTNSPLKQNPMSSFARGDARAWNRFIEI